MVEIVSDAVINLLGSSGTAPGLYESPLNAAASAQYLYVADTGNNRIQKLDTEEFVPLLSISTQFGLSSPASVDVANDPVQERLYLADTGNNRVLVIGVPRNDPTVVWNSALTNLVSGNTEAALSKFSTTSIDDFRTLFNTLGSPTVSSNMSAVGTLTPLTIDDDEARYYFTQTIDGVQFGFIVTFANEYGIWKIRGF